jgi:hypothetical protein
MNNEIYYILFFIFIGVLIVLYYYQLEQQKQQKQLEQQQQQQLKNHLHKQQTQGNKNSNGSDGNRNRCNDHIKLYQDTRYKRATANDVNESNYTYNIKNIDIHKDTVSDNSSKLGSPNNNDYEPELEVVFNTPLRGAGEHHDETNEIYGNNTKPNKTDLPIVNPPLRLLKYNAPLRLSERHLIP